MRDFDFDYGSMPVPALPPMTPAADAPPVTWGLRETPVGRPDTVGAGVVVPVLQGLAQGCLPAILVLTGSALLAAQVGWAWWAALVGGLVTLALVASWRVWVFIDKRQEVLWRREEVEHHDIDKDGHIGRPPVQVQVEVSEGRQMQILNVRIDAGRLAILAGGVLVGRPLSEREWTGGGRLLSLGEFRGLRGELLERGLARWVSEKDRRQGVELTAAGRAVFRRLEKLSPTLGVEGVESGGV